MKLKLHTTLASLVLASGCDSSPPPFKELPANYIGQVEDLNPSDDLTGYSTLASAQWSFEASTIENTTVEFDLQSNTVRQFGTMGFKSAKATVEHTQINRAQSVELFKQGTDERSMSEFFKQNENDDAQGLLDILIVIDNSGSMAEEQTNLSTKLLPLLTYVAQSDWKIGVVTTDIADGCLRDVITKGQANFETTFANAIKAGVSGSGVEAGVPQAVAALSKSCMGGKSWIRPNSTLAILIVSDEDNCSDGTKCAVPEQNTADYLLDHLATIREVGVNAKVFGLIWHPSQLQSECTTALRRGDVYSDLIAATGGSWGSICNADYSSTLQAMSLDLSLILKTQFALNYEPYLDSVEVTIDGKKVSSGYKITGNVIEFTTAPSPGARIYVNYRFGTAAPQEVFTLKADADPKEIKVYLDGKASTAFSYDANKRQVQFTRAPQAKEVKITYKKSAEMVKAFLAEAKLTKGDIKAYIDGTQVLISDFSYDTNSGLVTFASAPKDGAVVRFDYTRAIGPSLEYPIFAPEEALATVRVYDGYGNPLDARIEDQMVVFTSASFAKDKEFIVEYDNVLKQKYLFDLGFEIWGDSLSISGANSGICNSPVITGTEVDVRGCGFDGNEIVSLSFDFVREHQTAFTLEDTENLAVEDILSGDFAFVVYVNNKVVSNYTVDGATITFADLPIGSMVTVKLFRGHDS